MNEREIMILEEIYKVLRNIDFELHILTKEYKDFQIEKAKEENEILCSPGK